MFIGTFPMGLATIVNMVVFVCVPAWGEWAATFAWVLWIIDAVVSISICLFLPFAIMNFHRGTQLNTMTAAWLLPIVSTIVAAASGGIVAEVLPNQQHAPWSLGESYIFCGTGIPLAMSVLVIYFQRLTIHKLPPPEVIVSCFLPLGPLGQGAFGIMQLGKVAKKILPITNTLEVAIAGEVLYTLGWVIGLIMWGYGLVWMFFAISSISRSKFPFNMGWWGFTFPLGVYTVATTTFGKEMPSRFFDVLGTMFSIIVTLLWLVVALLTLRDAASGKLFFAPCLKEYAKKDAVASKDLESG
ncbi:Plasma membrane sulfite pump involved in sulfite metabolism [Oleoguttula sp. CCFEE 5521]